MSIVHRMRVSKQDRVVEAKTSIGSKFTNLKKLFLSLSHVLVEDTQLDLINLVQTNRECASQTLSAAKPVKEKRSLEDYRISQVTGVTPQ